MTATQRYAGNAPDGLRSATQFVATRISAAFVPDDSRIEGRAWLGYLAGIALAVAIVFLRQPGLPATETLWAEDGTVFLADAFSRPLAEVLLKPYAGYAHVVPRMLAEIARHLPIDLAAVVMSGGSILVVALLAAFVYRCSISIAHRPLRLAHASLPILLPVAIVESLGNAANLHWFLIYAAFWAFIWVPQHAGGRTISAAIVALAALSDPLTVLLAPLAIARLFAIRSWRNQIVTIVWVLALAVQIVVVIGSWARGLHGAGVEELAGLYGTHVVTLDLVGIHPAVRLWPELWTVMQPVGFGLALALTGYALIGQRSATRATAFLGLCTSGLLFVAAYWVNGVEIAGSGPIWSGLPASRYLVLPSVLFLSAVMLVMGARDIRVSPRRWSRLVTVALIWYAAVAAMSLNIGNGRAAGPAWSDALAQARSQCAGGVGTVSIPITPPSWTVTLDCRSIQG